VITWIQLYWLHADLWLRASTTWFTVTRTKAQHPAASSDSGQGRVVWASERFAARRQSRNHLSGKPLGGAGGPWPVAARPTPTA
jgi:hypothetical protein